MVALNQVLNANEIPERDDYSPIQPGTYTGMIVGSQMKPTSKGGEMLVLEIDVVDGEYQGRKLFERLNIVNPNEKAVEIAYKTLGEIIRACAKVTIKDSDELHNKRFSMVVVLDPAKPYIDKDGVEQAGSPQNRIKRYHVLGAATAGASMGAAAPATGTPPATTGTVAASGAAPWKR